MGEQTPRRGWFRPLNSRKFHYFEDDTMSLCGRCWVPALPASELDDEDHTHPDNCAACVKRRERREALERGEDR